jgi:hypothetical protein
VKALDSGDNNVPTKLEEELKMNRTLLWIGTIAAAVGGLAVLIGLSIGNQRPMPNAGVEEGLSSFFMGLSFLVFGGYVLVAGLAVVALHFVLRALVYILTGK